jgi:hypothetical protein
MRTSAISGYYDIVIECYLVLFRSNNHIFTLVAAMIDNLL